MKKLFIKIQNNKLLLLIIIVGSVLRFYHLDYQSVWLDEIHTLNEANPNTPFFDLYDKIIGGEQMPPLYFYTVYFLFKIFGYTAIVMRLYSAILGILAIISIFLLGKELFNKNVGLISALFLSINYFHLFHSQEARPYAFFVLFSILAFYRLILFLKFPTYKNGLYYGLFSSLMIYGHFFGLFALFSQYLIILLFLLISSRKKDFFKKAFVSGILTLILYIPSIKILINVSEIKEFWISAPTPDSFTIIFKEFFGGSEMVLALVGLFIVLYFISIKKADNFVLKYKELIDNKEIFSFLILFFWISTVVMIPLIRSYTSVPMLISRYFIVLLPAVIILMAIGIEQYKNKIITVIFSLIFLGFSLVDITIVKHYYTNISKSQFREATNFIKENNKEKESIVSSLGWYMPYFFNKNSVNYQIVDKNLDDYIAEMQNDTTKINAFWYIDGHGREFTTNNETLDFINKHFYIDNNFDGMGAWTKHFILLKNYSPTINLSKFNEILEVNGDTFTYNLEVFEKTDNIIKVSGWAFFENQDAKNTKSEIILIKENSKIGNKFLTQKANRRDVTEYFKNKFDLDNTGFNSTIDIGNIEPGSYRLAIYLVNETTKKEGFVITDKTVVK